MHADPAGGLEHHHGAGQSLPALLLGHKQRHQIAEVLLAAEAELAGLGLDLPDSSQRPNEKPLTREAIATPRTSSGGNARVVRAAWLAWVTRPLLSREKTRSGSALSRGLYLVVLPLGGHVGMVLTS